MRLKVGHYYYTNRPGHKPGYAHILARYYNKKERRIRYIQTHEIKDRFKQSKRSPCLDCAFTQECLNNHHLSCALDTDYSADEIREVPELIWILNRGF